LVLSCKHGRANAQHDGLTVTGAGRRPAGPDISGTGNGRDFKTLVSAVRGRPGAFVRTSQDLNQAALDRSRLERYLSAIRTLNDSDPSKLTEAAPLLARSLAIKSTRNASTSFPRCKRPA